MPSRLAVALVSVLAVSTTTAFAQDGEETRGNLGLGIEQTSTGATGATFVYDADSFRIAALLAMVAEGDSDFFLGARAFFPVHDSQRADFSIGFGAGIAHLGDPDTNDVHVEGAAQIRAFLVPNVAIGASLGAGIVIRDDNADRFTVGGQLVGTGGIWYFF